ncbi:hypothetical protein N5T96_06815 [Aliarcobacter butzleri]|uniref:hypothetical protein n=1 Tax=Aliarcobacter butzleri TaxID=28197 RepID=UPI0021B1C8BE|nr:hypothetical protein [Aliarcobacter butzleri]MCT7566049.1 hypothetical protein [Aliarcobacter butzleri]MCT7573399.1 hypothetical protein [Aliarcobacter butzleri]
MTTNAKRNEIRDRILDLKERTKRNKIDFQNELNSKKKSYERVFSESNNMEKSPIIGMSGFLFFILLIESMRKAWAIENLRKSLKANEKLKEQSRLVDDICTQVNNRLEIIAKAEKNDLHDFLKDNDVYSIFEDGKLEKFLSKEEKEKDKNKVKEKNQDKMENINER